MRKIMILFLLALAAGTSSLAQRSYCNPMIPHYSVTPIAYSRQGSRHVATVDPGNVPGKNDDDVQVPMQRGIVWAVDVS